MPYHLVILAIFLILAFITDITKQIIPNYLTLLGIISGVIYHTANNDIHGFIFSVLGMAVGFISVLFLYLFKAVGAGDVKLFAAIGAISGIEFVLYSIMYSVIYAGLIGLIILLLRKELIRRVTNIILYFIGIFIYFDVHSALSLERKELLTFPFMYAVMPGIITVFLYFV